MIGELAGSEIEDILRAETVGRLGCHARDRTYVVPMTYAYDGVSILGHTGDGLKVHMMRENPSVCFEVDQLGHLPSWRSVIVLGRYEELHDLAAAEALRLFLEQHQARARRDPATSPQGAGLWVPGSEPAAPRQSIVFAIRIDGKTGRFERRD